MKLLCTSIAALLLSFTGLAQQSDESSLSNIKKNGPIVTTEKIKDKVWPKVSVKAYIPATSLEAAAIFAAFDYQNKYIPNLLKSEVVAYKTSENGLQVDVRYVMDMPWPISDSDYINAHYFKGNHDKATYSVHWFMVESDSADDLKGSATFTPLPKDEGCLMVYQAHVDPKSFMAGALRKFMIKDVKASVNATVQEIVRLKKSESKLLKKYSDIFRDILSGKRAYLLKS